MTVRSLKRAIRERATPHPTKSSLFFHVLRGAAWKQAPTLVAGVLGIAADINLIASRGRPVIACDTSQSRVRSIFAGRRVSARGAFKIPHFPPNVDVWFDARDKSPIEVGCVFLLKDVPLPSYEPVNGAIMVGTEDLLRVHLKGRKFYVNSTWQDLIAVEVQNGY